MSKESYRRDSCRVCLGTDLISALSLGSTPPANAFLKKEDLSDNEEFFPLELLFCKGCSFIQLADIVSSDILFRDYVYVSSTSPMFVAHFEDLAQTICQRFELPQGSLVVDIGSNDGILLRPFKAGGMRVLGIDPAVKIAQEATRNGIETWPEFFSPEIARKVVRDKGHAQLVAMTSTFPHIDDLDAVITGVKILLDEKGVFLIEAYYLGDLLEKNLFDTIYHEHLSYFTVGTIVKLFKRLGMQVFDVEKTDTHGGSLRVFVQKAGGAHTVKESIEQFMRQEEEAGLSFPDTYCRFSQRIEKNKEKLLNLLSDLKARGKSIVGYGAPAKGNTLLNYFGIGSDTLDYIVDDSSWKQRLYTPGTHIPVVGPEQLEEQKPDYMLILAWNFAIPIMQKQSAFGSRGGKFIIPIPEPKVI